MGQKICLDTSVAIEIVNKKQRGIEISEALTGNDVCITSVTLFELLLRKTNLDSIELFAGSMELLNFDANAARKASEIDKELEKMGTPVGFRDIFIAATALVNDCVLATLNVKDFSRIKGLKLVKIS